MKNRLLAIGLSVVLLVGILGIVPGLLPIRMNKDFVAEWCVIFFIALFIKNRWLGVFVLWCLLSQIMSVYVPVVSLNKAYIIQVHTVVIYSFFYYLLFENINRENIEKVFDIIACLCILQVLMMLMQYNGIWIVIMPLHWIKGNIIGEFVLHPLIPVCVFERPWHYDCTGFMDMVNTSSALLALCLPVFFRKKWLWGIPFVFAGLWISRSMGGLIPALFITTIYVIVKQRKHARLFCLVMILFFLIFIKKFERMSALTTGSGRWDMWRVGLQLVKKKWIVGWGIGQSNFLWQITIRMLKIPGKWVHYHNEYLNLLIELGSVGLIIFIGYITDLFIRIKRYLRGENTFILTLGILVGLINCFVNFTMHGSIALVFITYLAITDKLSRGDL